MDRGKRLVEMALATQTQENEGSDNAIAILDNVSVVDDPMPSTSSSQVFNVMYRAEIDFSSDDSVQDPHYPHYQLPTLSSIPRSPSLSDSEESTLQHTVSPKKSVRRLKSEKKMKRNLGQAYKTLKGKTIPDRAIKELRLCRMKCKERIAFVDRHAIFTEYWQMGTYSKRSAYMSSLIEIVDKSTQRTRAIEPEKQKYRLKTYKYSFNINGKREPVCRACLLHTLDESENFIKTVALKKRVSTGGTLTDDMRGKTIPKHKISDEKRQEIKTHIMSFPAYESHYTRKSTSKKYLPSHLTMQKMYELFSENKDNSPSIKIYSQEFHKLGLSFKKPRVDTCYTCDKFQMQIQLCQTELEKSSLISQHEHHKAIADEAYDMKKADTQLSKNDDTLQVYTFDLQQCLPTPALNSSVAFYKRQLWTFNLTIHDNKTGNAVCYVWHEAIAGRGANQIASCVYKHLKNHVPVSTKHIIFYSDTCGGQNRNSHVSSMFTWFLQKSLTIETVDHKFMVPGHSHLEVDTDHGIIEKKKKKTELQIFHPHDWIQLIRSSSKKFKVVEMKNTDFFEFSTLLKSALVSRNKDTDGRQFKWLEKRWLRYEKEFGILSYKNTLCTGSPFFIFNFKRRGPNFPDSIPIITMQPLPISKEKKKDLMDLLPLIPDIFHEFYVNLSTLDSVRNTDPDILEEEEEENVAISINLL